MLVILYVAAAATGLSLIHHLPESDARTTLLYGAYVITACGLYFVINAQGDR